MDSDPGSRAVRPGAFGVGGVDPFEGRFCLDAISIHEPISSKGRTAALAEWRQLLSA